MVERVLGRNPRDPRSPSLGKGLKTFCVVLLYAKPYAGKQGPQSRIRPDPSPPVTSKHVDTPMEGWQVLALDMKRRTCRAGNNGRVGKETFRQRPREL